MIQEGKKYPCDSCDYQATRRGYLATHKQSIHDGKTYPSDYWEYLAPERASIINTNSQNIKVRNILVTYVIMKQQRKGHLTMHNDSINEGEKFPCD